MSNTKIPPPRSCNKHSINMGWHVRNKYYTMTEDVPVYVASLLLGPSKRARYIIEHWPEEWHSLLNLAIKFGREYKAGSRSSDSEHPVNATPSDDRSKNEFELILDEMSVARNLTQDVDDFKSFIHAAPIQISGSPLLWWCHRDQRQTYPRLSRMAQDILPIPPESVDAESSFSGAWRSLAWVKERMSCQNLERVECIGSWLREGHIQLASCRGMGIAFDQGITHMDHNLSDNEFD